MQYEELVQNGKEMAKAADELIEKLANLQISFAEDLTRLTCLIEPQTNALVYKIKEEEPDLLSLSQRAQINKDELDKKFKESLKCQNHKGPNNPQQEEGKVMEVEEQEQEGQTC